MLEKTRQNGQEKNFGLQRLLYHLRQTQEKRINDQSGNYTAKPSSQSSLATGTSILNRQQQTETQSIGKQCGTPKVNPKDLFYLASMQESWPHP